MSKSARRWSEEEDKLLKEFYPSMGAKGCVDLLKNRSLTAIRTRACNLNIKHIGIGCKHTDEWYQNELLRKDIPHFTLEPYTGYDTPILHECFEGHKTLRTPNNVLRGSECSVCSTNVKRTHEQYLAELKDKGILSKLIPIQEYINTDTSIKHQCLSCSYTWNVRPNQILRYSGCPKCKRPGGYTLQRFDKDPELAKAKGTCYLVALLDKVTKQKVYLKIGITKDVGPAAIKKRMQGISTAYDYVLLKHVKGTLLEMFLLEQALHVKWGKFSALPDKKFGGWLECFRVNEDIIRSFPTL